MNALKIVSRPATFRRANFAFNTTPRFLKLDDLKRDQIDALKNEPKLIVEEVEHDFGDGAAKKPAAGKTGTPKANALKVVAKKDGHQRAGFEFGTVPVFVSLDEHASKLRAIRDDGELTVEEVVHEFGAAA
ncbi:MAG: hypothetical protein NBV67_00795 [Tagaea sp.]|nr:hypothetical protein [Tagaea sp.]